jgi:hypothetical protein
MRKLTEEEKKIFKVFVLQCRAYGADTVEKSFPVDSHDFTDYGDKWRKNWGDSITENFDEIEDIIKKIITDSDLINIFEDTEYGSGWFDVYVDCIEKKIEISAKHYYLAENENGVDISMNEEREKIFEPIFKQMEEMGVGEGKVHFNGSGDSGDIYDTIDFGKDNKEINSDQLNELYRILESHVGGWEINEGSQGNFLFYLDGTIFLDYYENVEEINNMGTQFYDSF